VTVQRLLDLPVARPRIAIEQRLADMTMPLPQKPH